MKAFPQTMKVKWWCKNIKNTKFLQLIKHFFFASLRIMKNKNNFNNLNLTSRYYFYLHTFYANSMITKNCTDFSGNILLILQSKSYTSQFCKYLINFLFKISLIILLIIVIKLPLSCKYCYYFPVFQPQKKINYN